MAGNFNTRLLYIFLLKGREGGIIKIIILSNVIFPTKPMILTGISLDIDPSIVVSKKKINQKLMDFEKFSNFQKLNNNLFIQLKKLKLIRELFSGLLFPSNP